MKRYKMRYQTQQALVGLLQALNIVSRTTKGHKNNVVLDSAHRIFSNAQKRVTDTDFEVQSYYFDFDAPTIDKPYVPANKIGS